MPGFDTYSLKRVRDTPSSKLSPLSGVYVVAKLMKIRFFVRGGNVVGGTIQNQNNYACEV